MNKTDQISKSLISVLQNFINTSLSDIETFRVVLHNSENGVDFHFEFLYSKDSFSHSDFATLYQLWLSLWRLRHSIKVLEFTKSNEDVFAPRLERNYFYSPNYYSTQNISNFIKSVKK